MYGEVGEELGVEVIEEEGFEKDLWVVRVEGILGNVVGEGNVDRGGVVVFGCGWVVESFEWGFGG